MVGVKVTFGAVAGHDAPGGQRGEEEQPPAASTPATSAATRLVPLDQHHSASMRGRAAEHHIPHGRTSIIK
jgi:hypothetical protein